MKKAVKIIKDVQSYRKGNTYRIHKSFADKLILQGKAEVVEKESKVVYETKEEKFLGMSISTKNLAMVISGYTDEELLEIIKKDDRVTAKWIAEKEIERRES